MVSAHRLHTLVRIICLSWYIGVFIAAVLILEMFVNFGGSRHHSTKPNKNHNGDKVKNETEMAVLENAEIPNNALDTEHDEDRDEIVDILTKDDLAAIVNPHPFDYVINHEEMCSVKRPDIFLLVVVHTHPLNFKRRMHIRETWGNQKYYSIVKTVVLFAMGVTGDAKIQNSIYLESERYVDIVQENFTDTYRNLSYKGVSWLRWVSTYCPQALFVVKVDDDMIVNVFNLANHLKNLHNRNVVRTRSILCLVWNGMPVIREQTSKWFLSRQEYENDTFPPYCSGSAYVITRDLVPQMYHRSFYTKFVWVDDVFMTGILPQGLDFRYVDLASLYVLKVEEMEEKLVYGQKIDKIYGISNLHAMNKFYTAVYLMISILMCFLDLQYFYFVIYME